MTINEAMRTYRLPNPTTPEDLECRWSKVLNFGDKVLLAGYYYNGKNKPCYFGAVYTDAGHEIKTPLAIIKANIDLMGMELDGEDIDRNEIKESLGDINDQVGRLTGLTNDLVYLSRMEEAEGQLVMTDESLYLTEHGDGSHEAPFGAPRGTFDTWEEVEAFLEQVFDELLEDDMI